LKHKGLCKKTVKLLKSGEVWQCYIPFGITKQFEKSEHSNMGEISRKERLAKFFKLPFAPIT
jgi:hypothetical protein